MNRKIIFFDIDGTIFCTRLGHVTDRVKAAIAQARKRGHLCFIASGRPWAFIADNIRELGFDGYVLANGAHIKFQDMDAGIRYLCLLYQSPSPRDLSTSRMPSSA